MKSMARNQEGQTIPLVLVIMVVGAMIIAALFLYLNASLLLVGKNQQNIDSYYAADSGIEDAICWLIEGKAEGPWTGSDDQGWERDIYSINDSSVKVSVEAMQDLGANMYRITSNATAVDGDGHTTVLSTVWAIPFIEGPWKPAQGTYEGDVYVHGDVKTGTWAEIIGDVYVTGDIDLHNHSSITGNVSVEGNIDLDPQSSIIGNVCAGGDITIENDAIIKGDIYISGDHTIKLEGGQKKEARIEGNIHADGNITIIARNSATLQGNVYVVGNLTIILEQAQSAIDGSVYATGDITIALEQEGRISGSINRLAYPEGYPPPPDCPPIPLKPVSIQTYEIE